MGIIGSYRGCDSCYKWKKKCDTTQPGQPCSRCRTKNLPCTGAGQQRLKFKNKSLAARDGLQRLEAQETHTQLVKATKQSSFCIEWPLRNDSDRVASTIVEFSDSTHPGYSLMSFGSAMLSQLPKRICYSTALNASVTAFTSILENQQTPFNQPNPRTLQLYISALKALRDSLSNPVERYDTNTMCSVTILTFCHVWMAQHTNISRGHANGLAHLISIGIHKDLGDPFHYSVLSAMAVHLIEDSVFIPNIQLIPWIQKLYSRQHSTGGVQASLLLPSCELRVFATIANLIRFPKENKEQIQWTYTYFLERYTQLRDILGTDQVLRWNTREMMLCNERHGAFLSIAVVLNAFLGTFNPSNVRFLSEREMFCADAISLGERAKNERPLSAHHVPIAIVSAWCVTKDATEKGKLRQLIDDYRDTFPMARMAQQVAYWREGPVKLQEIPWFKCRFTEDNDQNSNVLNAEGKEVTGTKLDEFCCIL